MAVRVPLAVVAEEQVEAVLVGIALGAGRTQAPLAHRAGGVTLFLEQLGDGDLISGDGLLALGLDLAVVADVGMAAVLARHQATARRSADRRAAVRLGEAHTLRRQPVDVRGANLLLTVAADFVAAQVIREDEDDVRPLRLGGPRRLRRGGEHCHDKGSYECEARLHDGLLCASLLARSASDGLVVDVHCAFSSFFISATTSLYFGSSARLRYSLGSAS